MLANKVKPLDITLAQLNPTLGDINGNTDKILNTWKSSSGDLVVFPELFLCGYPPEDLVLNPSFIKLLEEKIKFICNESKKFSTAIIIPTPWKIDNKLYNAALLIENGAIKHIFTKYMLPNHSVFDEKRVFCKGDLPTPYEFRGTKLGIMICEDMWHEDVPKHLKDQGAEILIAINGSPYSYTQHDKRINIARKTGLELIYLNMVGGQDELVFDGRSFIMDNKGEIIFQAKAFEEEIFNLNISNNILSFRTNAKQEEKSYKVATNKISPFHVRDDKKYDELELIYNALKLGLKDYVHKNGFKNALIGLSGGIDSALTAAIATDALGANNVHCVIMPSKFTAQSSIDDAKECAKMLGVKYDITPITEALTAFENIIPSLNGIAHENTQSRIRGAILMAMSNTSGAMVISTGNKSEMAVGYCTLYGDMNGGFNALKDIYKTQVYELSKWRKLPQNIINKEPSAELRDNQKDQDSLPPYDLLDDILKLLIEHDNIDFNNPPKELQKTIDKCLKHPETVKKIARLLKNSEYKRRQSPIGTRISSYNFGRDRRYPMTNYFVNMIAKSE